MSLSVGAVFCDLIIPLRFLRKASILFLAGLISNFPNNDTDTVQYISHLLVLYKLNDALD